MRSSTSKILKSNRPEKPAKVAEQETEFKSFEDLVDEYFDSLEGDIENPLTTTIPKFDKVLKNKLRGTVGAYIGKGGSKKSLLSLQACNVNVRKHQNNCTGIYSNMEMGTAQFVARSIDMTKPGYNTNASEYIEFEYTEAYKKGDKDSMARLRTENKEFFRTYYGKNLVVYSKSNMSVDDYHRLITSVKNKNGRVDMMVVDGLSMMATKGNETDTYSANSKELKDLAKLHNIFIPLICHVTKAATKHTRDLQEFIRGSEKILDNVDFMIMTSLCIDEMRSTETATEYMSDKGYLRLYDKRGSGQTVNVIYDFNPLTLSMTQTDHDPKLFEVQKKKPNLFE
jgi:replicative DNA helicase